MFAVALALVYFGFRFTGSSGLFEDKPDRFIINDFHSLVMIPTETGECQAAVGYKEKHVIGTFVAEPVKEMVCEEYYFSDRPEAIFPNGTIVLVQLETGEYHWVLQSQLVVKL